MEHTLCVSLYEIKSYDSLDQYIDFLVLGIGAVSTASINQFVRDVGTKLLIVNWTVPSDFSLSLVSGFCQ